MPYSVVIWRAGIGISSSTQQKVTLYILQKTKLIPPYTDGYWWNTFSVGTKLYFRLFDKTVIMIYYQFHLHFGVAQFFLTMQQNYKLHFVVCITKKTIPTCKPKLIISTVTILQYNTYSYNLSNIANRLGSSGA